MTHRLENAKRLSVGTKQTLKALQTEGAKVVYIANDAASELKSQVLKASKEGQVPVVYVGSMVELGKLCNIDVGAAAAALLQ